VGNNDTILFWDVVLVLTPCSSNVFLSIPASLNLVLIVTLPLFLGAAATFFFVSDSDSTDDAIIESAIGTNIAVNDIILSI
jgi:hypothetical protein